MMFQMGLQQQKLCHLRGFVNTLILVNREFLCVGMRESFPKHSMESSLVEKDSLESIAII